MPQQLAFVDFVPADEPPAAVPAPIRRAAAQPQRLAAPPLAVALALPLPEPPPRGAQVRLRCVQVGRSKHYRVRIVAAPFPFDPSLNCRFPREGRVPGQEWLVPVVRTGRRHYLTGPVRLIVEAPAADGMAPHREEAPGWTGPTCL